MIALSIAIGFVYFGLVEKLMSVYYNRQIYDKMCDGERYSKDCSHEKEQILSVIDSHSMMVSFVLAIIALLISISVFNNNVVLSSGLAYGSVFIIAYEVFANWHRFDDKTRLGIYAASFGVLSTVAYSKFSA